MKMLEKWLWELEIRGKIESIKTTALLKLTRIVRRVEETCCHFSEKVDGDVKNS